MFCLGSDRWCQLMWPTTQLTTASRPARRSASWSCPGWPPSSDLSQQHPPIMFRWGVTSHHHHPIMFRGGVTSQEHHLITFRWGVTSQQHHPIMGEAWRHSNIIQSWVWRVTSQQYHQITFRWGVISHQHPQSCVSRDVSATSPIMLIINIKKDKYFTMQFG